jgi:ferritin
MLCKRSCGLPEELIFGYANDVNMDAELLKKIERLESKVDRILELLEEELTEEEIEELNRISERMKKGEKIPLDDLL